MRAALALLAAAKPGPKGRRIAVIGDMLELGPKAAAMHAELAADLSANKVDLLFGAGPLTRALYEAAPASMRAAWTERSSDLTDELARTLRGGDIAMVKGSNGSRMGPLVVSFARSFRSKRGRLGHADLAGGTPRRLPSVPISDLPHARRGGDRAFPRLLLRSDDHLRVASETRQGAADPRRRTGFASSQQEGHADHGRPHDPVRAFCLGFAVGQSRKPLCVDRAVRHRGFRRHRILRRLSESHEAVGARLLGSRTPVRRICHRRARLLCADAGRRRMRPGSRCRS